MADRNVFRLLLFHTPRGQLSESRGLSEGPVITELPDDYEVDNVKAIKGVNDSSTDSNDENDTYADIAANALAYDDNAVNTNVRANPVENNQPGRAFAELVNFEETAENTNDKCWLKHKDEHVRRILGLEVKTKKMLSEHPSDFTRGNERDFKDVFTNDRTKQDSKELEIVSPASPESDSNQSSKPFVSVNRNEAHLSNVSDNHPDGVYKPDAAPDMAAVPKQNAWHVKISVNDHNRSERASTEPSFHSGGIRPVTANGAHHHEAGTTQHGQSHKDTNDEHKATCPTYLQQKYCQHKEIKEIIAHCRTRGCHGHYVNQCTSCKKIFSEEELLMLTEKRSAKQNKNAKPRKLKRASIEAKETTSQPSSKEAPVARINKNNVTRRRNDSANRLHETKHNVQSKAESDLSDIVNTETKMLKKAHDDNTETNSFDKVFARIGFTMRNVSADGNCLFSAMVDQLRIRGVFEYTPRSLRTAAVNYLRQNPQLDDGTNISGFIEGDLEDYFQKMNQDGSWGDHIVIHGLACFLKTPVTIFGCDEKGMIRPRPEIIAGKHKENATVYLGHLHGSHYISLRPQNWKNYLLEVLGRRTDSCVISGRTSELGVSETGGDVPDVYLSFAMMYCLKQQIIRPLVQEQVPIIRNHYRLYNLSTDHYDALFVGILGFHQETCYSKEDVFLIPLDTVVVSNFTASVVHKRNQLKAVRQENDNTINLMPENPENWKSCLNQELCLHHLQMPSYEEKSPRWIAFQTKMPTTERWLERSRRYGWPPNGAIYDLLTGDGFLVVPAPKFSKYSWTFDFRLAEDILLAKAVTDYQKECFKVTKILLDETQVSQYLPYVLVKHAFYYQCQETSADVWNSDPALCVRSLIGRLVSNLNVAFSPNFFDSTLNLMPNKLSSDERSLVYQRLSIAQKHTFVCLCNAFSTPATDFEDRWSRAFAAMFNRLVESMQQSNTETVLEDCFIPTAVAGIQELVERERFALAYERCKEAAEELNHIFNAKLSVNKIVNLVISHASYNVRHWLFAFFVSFVTGQKWFDTINKDLDSILLVDVFGEGLNRILVDRIEKEVHIPTPFIEPERICQTTLVLAKVLEQCDIDEDVIARVELTALDYVIIQMKNRTSNVSVPDITIADKMREVCSDVGQRTDRQMIEIANIRKKISKLQEGVKQINMICSTLREMNME